METKTCGRCKQIKPLIEFYKSKRDGYRSRCKPCHNLDVKEYYKRPGARRRQKIYQDEYRKRSYVKAKIYARNCTTVAIKMGRICRGSCAVCGKEQGQVHHLDYNEPLMIVWLCPNCHRRLHKQLSLLGG